MDTLTPTQRLIVNTMAKQSGSLGSTEVNKTSLQSLVGKGLVEEVSGDYVLTDEGWESSDIEAPVIEMGESIEQPVDAPPPDDTTRSELWVEIGSQMTIQVGVTRDRQPIKATIPIGTRCPVVGFNTEKTRRGKVTWYQLATPKGLLLNDEQVGFMVAIAQNSRVPSQHRLLRYDFDDEVTETEKIETEA